MKSILIAVVILFCLATVSHAARLDTSFSFSTLETQHFSIHYHQGLEQAARKAARFAEEAYGKLVPEFIWVPEEKTQLVLIDNSDFTNGLSITIPYNTIYVQVVPPSLASTIGEYDDWLKEVITHEYAHIVTSDAARGFSRVTRNVFGKPLPWLGDPFTELLFIVTAPPNTFMPRWWHEGMATWSETEYTGEGRGKGSFYDMVFRAAVAENRLPRVDEINGDVPYWPNGSLPYLYGYRLQRYLADTYGKEALGRVSMAHSGRFPYFISSPPEEIFGGKNYRELYLDMLQAVREEQSEKIDFLSKAPFTQLTTISREGEDLSYPRFSPDGKRLAYTRGDPHDHTYVIVTETAEGQEVARFRRQLSEGSICWAPDGGGIFFTQAEVNRGFDLYQDLYLYDLKKESVKRLTRGERLSDVDVSPDGKLIATVVSSRGSQNLALMETSDALAERAHPRLVTDFSLQRLSYPRWSPDGNTICYAVKDNAGHSSVRLYETATGRDRLLFSTSHSADYPVWSRDGSCIFYISDETGVFNLFAYDLKAGKSYQVSHLLTGALQPEPSPDGRSIAVSGYSSRGFNIAQMTLDRSTWSEKRGPSLPARRGVAALPEGAGGAGQETSDPGSAESAASSRPYSVLQTVYPHFWLPRLSDDGSDNTVLGAFTAGADVLGYNSYALAADYSPGRKRGYFNLLYNNDYLYPTLSLKAHIQPYLYSNLEERGDYWELNQSLTLEAAVPINFLESRYVFNFGYQLLDQSALSPVDPYGRFNGVTVFQGRADNVFAGVFFDNVLRYPYSISSEEGRRISFLYRRYDHAIGSDQDVSEYSAEYREYLRLPIPALQHHVLYLRLSGALADGDLRQGQQAFQIGGIPSDLNRFPLRGYPDRFVTGKYVATGTLEYRAPIFNPMHGPGTLPLFAEKLHGAAFVDAGEVWDDSNSFEGNKIKVGAGFEARADVTLGYWLKVTPALGFAHGFSRGGENQIYLTLYVNL